MKNKLLGVLMAGSLSFAAFAEESSAVFTYVDGDPEVWGKGRIEQEDVAMRIYNPALKGKKITSVKAYVNNGDSTEVLSMWLTSELRLKNKVNTPDICSMTPRIESLEIVPGMSVREITAELEEAYTFDGEPVFVGFSINVTDNKTDADKTPFILSSGGNPDGFYFHGSKTELKWKNYSGTVDAVPMIYVTVEGEFSPYCVSITQVPYSYASAGEPYEVETTVSNIGTEDVLTVGYTYMVDGQTFHGEKILDAPLKQDIVGTEKLTFLFESIAKKGVYDASLTIDKINGHDNEGVSPTAVFQVEVLPFVPVHRALVEEFTGTWCGWCTRGYVAMELFDRLYDGKVIGVAYHDKDQMQVTESYPVAPGGLPCASLNRQPVFDPYFGSHWDVDFGISISLDECLAELTFADIFPVLNWNDESKTELTVNSDVRFVKDMEGLDYSVGYLLAADGVHNPKWLQSNYYSGTKETGYLADICEWPKKVGDLIYNEVVIDVSCCKGISGTIPAEVLEGELYSNSHTFEVGDSVQNINGVNFPIDKDKLFVAAFIIDRKTGRIVNANKAYVPTYDFNVVEGITCKEPESLSVEYFDMSGRRVNRPVTGLYVKVEHLSDGSFRSRKIVIK